MKRKFLIGVAVLLYVLAFTALSAEEAPVSASACAKRLSDGTVVDCEVSPDESKRLHESISAMRLINQKYPGPQEPDFANLYEVTSVDDRGRIKTSEGLLLMPAGVQCSAEMIKFLRHIFLKEPRHKIAFVLTGDEAGDAKYAYMWGVDNRPDEKATSNTVQFGPAYSSVNEGGITSQWCVPVPQKNHRYHERYKALVKWK
jgi:hypothetical protein